MANYKGNHSQLKRIQKGERLNPSGRPKIPKDLVKIRKKYTKETIQGLIAQCLDKSVEELQVILKDKNNKVVDHLVGRVCLLGIVKGDPIRFNFILDRLIGKVKEEQEVKLIKPFIIETLEGEMITLGAEDVVENEKKD